MVQRSTTSLEAERVEDLAGRIQANVGSGSNLDSTVQRQLEHSLGADLSGVRVHTDSEADHLARSVNAVAFTSGSDIFFRNGGYNPGTTEGMQTLAHEAVHTVQQASGPVDGTPASGGVSVSDPGDRFERAASEAAHHVVSGAGTPLASAAPSAASPAVQREESPLEEDDASKKKKKLEEEGSV
jgi:hypothetical protein